MDIKHCNVLLQHSQRRECMGVLCTWVKLLTDLQILGWGSYSTPRDPLAVIKGREGGKRKERVVNR